MNHIDEARVLAVLALADEVPTAEELQPYLDDGDPTVRRTALSILTEAAPPDAGAALARALLDGDDEVRTAAIEGFLELRELVEADEELRRALAEAAGSPDPAVRGLTLQLQREHHLGDVGLFARALDDEVSEVRRHAIAGLVALGSWEAITTARDDPDPTVRLAVARALGTVAAPEASDALRHLGADDDERVRAAAFEAFVPLGCPPALALVAVEGLGHDDWAVRKGAALALGAAPAVVALDPLKAALEDRNLDVRKAAVQSLSTWAQERSDVADALRNMLQDPDADVRAYARMALS